MTNIEFTPEELLALGCYLLERDRGEDGSGEIMKTGGFRHLDGAA